MFYCKQIRIDNRYREQLGDDLQILVALYFLNLGDFGNISQCNDPKPLCKDHHCFGVFLKLFLSEVFRQTLC
jgi:hypothetical protein